MNEETGFFTKNIKLAPGESKKVALVIQFATHAIGYLCHQNKLGVIALKQHIYLRKWHYFAS